MAYVLSNESGSFLARIDLSKPILHEGRLLNSIELRRNPKAFKRFRKAAVAGTADMPALLDLIVQSSGIPLAVVSRIRSSDLRQVLIKANGAAQTIS